MASAEEAVSNYLKALAGIQSAEDQATLDNLKADLENETDPMKRVVLRTEIEQYENPDTSRYAGAFIGKVNEWLKHKDISRTHAVAAFKAEGVPQDVLDRAFPDQAKATTKSKSSSPRQSREDVKSIVETLGSDFTITDVEDLPGVTASRATITAAVNELVKAGKLKDKGEDPNHEGRGRAATLYGPK